MKTRITEMVGIKYPIVLSGMSWISTPKMVAAVAGLAGGLGILATGPLNAEQTRESAPRNPEADRQAFRRQRIADVPGRGGKRSSFAGKFLINFCAGQRRLDCKRGTQVRRQGFCHGCQREAKRAGISARTRSLQPKAGSSSAWRRRHIACSGSPSG